MPHATVHPPRGERPAAPLAARSSGGVAGRRAGVRAAGETRGWTGRAATSRATDSGLPLLVVSARCHRTRVSEMRGAAARRGLVAPSQAGRATAARRAPALPTPARRGLAPSVTATPAGVRRGG